ETAMETADTWSTYSPPTFAGRSRPVLSLRSVTSCAAKTSPAGARLMVSPAMLTCCWKLRIASRAKRCVRETRWSLISTARPFPGRGGPLYRRGTDQVRRAGGFAQNAPAEADRRARHLGQDCAGRGIFRASGRWEPH